MCVLYRQTHSVLRNMYSVVPVGTMWLWRLNEGSVSDTSTSGMRCTYLAIISKSCVDEGES